MANTFTANASLPKPIDEARLFEDLENLQEAHNTAMDTLEAHLIGSTTITAQNATVLNTLGRRIIYLTCHSAGSIATISNMWVNQPFTIVALSGASFGITDTAPFLLNAALIFTPGDTLTLVWDGTTYYELGRSVN